MSINNINMDFIQNENEFKVTLTVSVRTHLIKILILSVRLLVYKYTPIFMTVFYYINLLQWTRDNVYSSPI